MFNKIILWLVFFLIPISYTTLLVDNFVVIKWIIVYLVSLLFTLQQIFSRKPTRLAFTQFIFFALLILIYRGLLLFVHPPLSMEWYSYFEGLLFLYLLWSFQIEHLNWDDWLEEAQWPFLLGLSFVLTRSLYYFFLSRLMDGYFGVDAFASSFGNINMLAEYIILSLPLLLFYTNKGLKLGSNQTSHFCYSLGLLLLGISLFILYWSRCRSAQLGFLALFIYSLWKLKWSKQQYFILIGVVTSIIGLSLYWSQVNMDSLDKAKLGSNTARFSLIQSGLALLADKPFGIGTEKFEFYNAPYRLNTKDPFNDKMLDRGPHNEILRWGIEYGWIYLLILATFGIWFFSKIKKFRTTSSSPLNIQFFMSFILVLLPQVLFQFPFQNAFAFISTAFFIGGVISKLNWTSTLPFKNTSNDNSLISQIKIPLIFRRCFARMKISSFERHRKSSSERDRAKAIAPLVRRLTESLERGAFQSNSTALLKASVVSSLSITNAASVDSSPSKVILFIFLITTLSTGVCFTWSKYEEVNGAPILSRAQRACNLYPINWRSCINAAQIEFNLGKYTESLQHLREELERHPFNVIALRFTLLNLLKLEKQNLACETAEVYEAILHHRGEFQGFLQNICKTPRSFSNLEGRAFERAYFKWFNETKVFKPQ